MEYSKSRRVNRGVNMVQIPKITGGEKRCNTPQPFRLFRRKGSSAYTSRKHRADHPARWPGCAMHCRKSIPSKSAFPEEDWLLDAEKRCVLQRCCSSTGGSSRKRERGFCAKRVCTCQHHINLGVLDASCRAQTSFYAVCLERKHGADPQNQRGRETVQHTAAVSRPL